MLIGNPMIYRQLPVEMAISKTVAAGFEALELWPPQIAEFRTPALRGQLRDHLRSLGVEPLRLNCADCDYFQSLASSEDSAQALTGLQRHIDAVVDLGMSQLLTWEGRRPAGFSDADVDGPLLDATTNLFRQACQYGEQRGVELTVEVHPFTLGMRLGWLIELCNRLNDLPFSVTYDCCHFGVGLPNDYVAAIERLGRRIGHVHFSDSDLESSELHFAPGTGLLDLEGIVAALGRIDFEGTMMLDLWLYPLPDRGVEVGVPYVRRVCQTLGLGGRRTVKA